LVDIESTNGTYHNVEMVTPGVARELADGDIIILGRLMLTLRIVHSPQNEPPVFVVEQLPNFKVANAPRSGQ
jgi:pSer/pThr/pTyr-binding forkhead associated (FHA) protein